MSDDRKVFTRREHMRLFKKNRAQLKKRWIDVAGAAECASFLQDEIDDLDYEKSLLYYIDESGYDRLLAKDPTRLFELMTGDMRFSQTLIELTHGGLSDDDCMCWSDDDDQDKRCLNLKTMHRTLFRALPSTKELEAACADVFRAVQMVHRGVHQSEQWKPFDTLIALIIDSQLWKEMHEARTERREKAADEFALL